MKFQALSTFTVPMPDQMHVFNAGTKGELPDAIMAQYVEAGLAKPLKGKAAKPDPEPQPEVDADDDDAGDDAADDAATDDAAVTTDPAAPPV